MSTFEAHLLGVRGSTAAPGRAFVRYGGHTSCVAISLAGHEPHLLLDAGSGVRELGSLLTGPFTGSVVLSHLHWDHTQGLPFSSALLHVRAAVRIVVPVARGASPLAALRAGFSPPVFPVDVDAVSPGWSFAAAEPFDMIGPFEVRTARVRHKGGVTIGVRVEMDGASLVYLPDHDLAEADRAATELARDADVLLHDAQYLATEIRPFRSYGHSTVERACAFADGVGAGRLVLTHHAPDRTDDELDAIAAEFAVTPGGLPVSVAREGDVLTVTSGRRPR